MLNRRLALLLTSGACIFLILPALSIWGNGMSSRKFRYTPHTSTLEELHYAIETMQDHYFQLWLGTWPTCIDWTAAVMGTYVSATLYSLTRSLDYDLPPNAQQSDSITAEGQRIENEINKYFSQAVSYYFGEDAFSIRNQAYDDMLWVVLGWLENIRFINLHVDAHYPTQGSHSWYGKQFKGAFAHRARIFYDLAKKGYDTRDCGGGMVWNPRLIPYKNAITNELFISASVSMYLHFPGDSNTSPFYSPDSTEDSVSESTIPPANPHDKEYLQAAIDAYDWLIHSNMINSQGLFIDGFHISKPNISESGRCDVRNEMVYTYNQGVILSGLRGLWESTGNITYLQDGHKLARSVITATGFNITSNRPSAGEPPNNKWHGLGRNGVLEELCDATGSCSQDGQNFKGIFFHHFTLFCESLPLTPLIPGVTYPADPELAALHRQSCKEYASWVARNAIAAMSTRDANGRFGGWWGHTGNESVEIAIPVGAEDYRNRGLGDPKRWGRGWEPILLPPTNPDIASQSPDLESLAQSALNLQTSMIQSQDANDRGRGRTVETQGAGVAVVRAMWEFVNEHSR
jgi:hypothetical protein